MGETAHRGVVTFMHISVSLCCSMLGKVGVMENPCHVRKLTRMLISRPEQTGRGHRKVNLCLCHIPAVSSQPTTRLSGGDADDWVDDCMWRRPIWDDGVSPGPELRSL